ncbi:MAG: dTDP-4-dehydrorhamnose reductase [Planctomycetes bacterium]|nr:dTDP-4-dehydrorhamnose reductase [Planctomycetota bacterium]
MSGSSRRVAVVLGARGMLGSELLRRAPKGLEVFGVAREEADVSRLDSLRDYFRRVQPAIVVNAAAYTAVDAAEQDRAAAFRVNSDGARNGALAAREVGARFLHVSTDFVFDGKATRPYGEFAAPNPQGAYAESKHAGELAVAAAGGDWQIVRTQWVFGARGKHFVGAIARAAAERDRLTVVADQRGCPTCTHDLAPEIWRIAEEAPAGLYHASSMGECTWHELACEIVKLLGRATRVDPITTEDWNRMKPGSAPRPAYSVLEKLHLERTIGCHMPHWKDALAGFIRRGDQ